jgi:colanic acid biosynthesis glycosyl transferase WcaI
VGDGPEKPKLQALARKLRLRNVSFHDSVPLEQLAPMLALSNAAVVTLRRAAITRGARPAKCFVMMAAGKPIVLAAEGEAAALIESAKCGFVVPPDQPRKLAGAILKLLANPATAREFGERGREFVKNNFEWSLLVEDWLNQLNRRSEPGAKENSYEPSVQKSHASL